MKILWLSHILPYPPKGGVMQRSYNLIKEVTKENEVYLFAFNQKAWLPTKEDIIKAKNLSIFAKKLKFLHSLRTNQNLLGINWQ